MMFRLATILLSPGCLCVSAAFYNMDGNDLYWSLKLGLHRSLILTDNKQQHPMITSIQYTNVSTVT